MSRRAVYATALCGVGALAAYKYRSSGSVYSLEVREHLRSALRAEHKGLLRDAEQHFGSALKICAQQNMPSASDAVTGIQIRYAQLKEVSGEKQQALRILGEVFESLRREIEVDKVHTGVRKLVGVAQKMGDLHRDLGALDEAEGHYIWAIETLLKNARLGSSRAEKAMRPPEVLSAHRRDFSPLLDSLAHLYRSQKKTGAAAHLFELEASLLQSKEAGPILPCRSLIVICNAVEAAVEQGRMAEAKSWIAKGDELIKKASPSLAKDLIAKLIPLERFQTEDHNTCAAGLCVLANSKGKVAEMLKDFDHALLCYRESVALGEKHNIKGAIREGNENIKQLEGRKRD